MPASKTLGEEALIVGASVSVLEEHPDHPVGPLNFAAAGPTAGMPTGFGTEP